MSELIATYRVPAGSACVFGSTTRFPPPPIGWKKLLPGEGQNLRVTATLDVSLDDDFINSLTRLDPAKSHRVLEAVELLRSNPDHPNLHLKPLHGELDQLWSARAGRDVRILLVRRGNTIVLLEAGMRRDVYDRAARGRFVVNPHRRLMGFVDVDASAEERRVPLPSTDRPTTADQPRVFDHWTDLELRAVDISEAELVDLRSCVDEYDLSDRRTLR